MKHFTLDIAASRATSVPLDLVRWASEQPRAAAAIPDIAGLAMVLLDANPDVILLVDAGGKTLWANQAARSRPAFALLTEGQRHGRTALSRPSAGLWARAFTAARHGDCPHFGVSTRDADGQCWWDVRVTRVGEAADESGQFLVVGQDVSAQHHAKPAPDAGRDSLTGLAHQDLFHTRIRAMIASGRRGFSVIMIDLDQLRELNEIWGRGAGDHVLRTVGARIARSLRLGEVAARLGGDEFGVVLLDDDTPDAAAATQIRAQAMVDRLTKAIRGDSKRAGIALSVGLARYPCDGSTAVLLCRNAKAALADAKLEGRGRIVCADPARQASQVLRNQMIARAECALAGRNIMPFYQPKVDLRSGRVVGFEALLRWRAPSGAIELPATIWPAFTDPAVSRRLTEAMMSRVFIDLVRWHRRGILLPVAVNVSDNDLREPDFAERMLARMAAAGLPNHCLELEITETAFIGRNSDDLAATLRTLRAAGIRIALDDFGTGYASLVHLKQLPVDIIKIDQSFVANLRHDAGDRAIVEAMVCMAGHLGLEVVAEGIEDPEDAAFLRDLGCRLGQGFLFGKAMPATAVPGLVAAAVASNDDDCAFAALGEAI